MTREDLSRTVLTSLGDGVWLATEPVRIVGMKLSPSSVWWSGTARQS